MGAQVWRREDAASRPTGEQAAPALSASAIPAQQHRQSALQQHPTSPTATAGPQHGQAPGPHQSGPRRGPMAGPSGAIAQQHGPGTGERRRFPGEASAQGAPPKGPPLKRAKIDNTAANLQQKQREQLAAMEELRRKIKQAEEEEERKKAKLKAEQEAKELAAKQQAEKQRRTEQLRKGFGSLAASAAAAPMPAPDAAGTSGHDAGAHGEQQQSQQQQLKAAPAAADAAEVARVLESKNDYQCLRLHVGATMAQVNKAYKALSLMLHPDKCSLEGAHRAWQRVKQARDNLARASS